eukprot:TRINITY_DN110020_c0_g1_i1.p1 TRINITY_DN110020_c0_g1~~TRINITY_DN110020_c0_g1_i1.p1  ORF type:complete len:688 (+),score=170.16 TRINITY_DN110020_c0_g1_i1:186-2066(+)
MPDWLPDFGKRESLVGKPFPSVALPNQDGKLISIPLGGLDAKPVVIFFYGGSASPRCTREARTFRSKYDSFTKFGAKVFGVSRDSVSFQKRWIEKENLPFDLLSDEDGKVRQLLAIPNDLFLDGRETYVIGKDGLVKKIYNNQLEPESHANEALMTLAEIYVDDEASSLANDVADGVSDVFDAAREAISKLAEAKAAAIAKDTWKLVEEAKALPSLAAEAVSTKAAEARELASDVAAARAAEVVKDTEQFIDEVKTTPAKNSQRVRDLLYETADSVQAQVEATAEAKRNEAQAQIEEMKARTQQRIEETQAEVQAAPGKAKRQMDQLISRTADSVQASVQAKKDEAQAKLDDWQAGVRRRIEEAQAELQAAPLKAQRQVEGAITRTVDGVKAKRDEAQARIDEAQADARRRVEEAQAEMQRRVQGTLGGIEARANEGQARIKEAEAKLQERFENVRTTAQEKADELQVRIARSGREQSEEGVGLDRITSERRGASSVPLDSALEFTTANGSNMSWQSEAKRFQTDLKNAMVDEVKNGSSEVRQQQNLGSSGAEVGMSDGIENSGEHRSETAGSDSPSQKVTGSFGEYTKHMPQKKQARVSAAIEQAAGILGIPASELAERLTSQAD